MPSAVPEPRRAVATMPDVMSAAEWECVATAVRSTTEAVGPAVQVLPAPSTNDVAPGETSDALGLAMSVPPSPSRTVTATMSPE